MSNQTCREPECGKASATRDYCRVHYQRLVRSGEIQVTPRIPPKERFYRDVAKKSDTDCWEWQGHLSPAGYGVLKIGKRVQGVHRYSYELANGPIDPGLVIDHICHNPSCVNPSHLQAVTHGLNLQNRQGANSNSRTGVRGVYWDKVKRKYVAQGRKGGQRIHIGYFKTLEEADEAAGAWRKQHYPNSLSDRGR